MAALTDQSKKLGKILKDLRVKFPTINWKCNLNSNMIRGYYPSENDHHILLLYYRSPDIFEASLRCYKLSGREQDKDAAKALYKLKDYLFDKRAELEEAITALTNKGVENE